MLFFGQQKKGYYYVTSHEQISEGADFKNDRPGYIASGIAHELSGLAIFSILPIFVAALITEMGLTTSQGGYVASADIIGISLSSLAAFFWINRVPWKTMSRFLLIGLITANIVCCFLTGFEQIFVARLICGLMEGSLFALAIAMLSRTSRPDRNFALTFCASLLTGAVNIFLMSYLIQIFGIKGVFFDLILFCSLPLLFWRSALPTRPMARGDAAPAEDKSAAPKVVVMLILLANLIYFCGQGGLWSYVKQMASLADLDEEAIKSGLSISLLAGMAGAGFAAWLDVRVGRALPLAVALLLAIASVYVLSTDMSAASFTLAVCLYNFGSNIGHPYLFGYLASIDPAGKFVVASGAMQTGGMGLGPAIVAYFIIGDDLGPVLTVAYVAFIGALVLFMPIMLLIRGKSTTDAQSGLTAA